jgi:two-component system sensor histidine kinase KdpD
VIPRAWRPWLLGLGALVVTTVALRLARDGVNQAHATLLYLLVVLAVSAKGGRGVGLTTAAVASVLIDYFFQVPYDDFDVARTVDVLALLAFMTTALVATHLVTTARAEAAEARRRTAEAWTLARLGAETLRHASPDAALDGLASLAERTLGAACARCVLCGWPAIGGRAPDDVLAALRAERRLADALAAGRALVVAANGAGGTFEPTAIERLSLTAGETVVLPLRVERRVVGLLTVRAADALPLAGAPGRLLTALAHYGALVLEWRRASDEAAREAALGEAGRLREVVLASLSHDLRTPLATITALAQDAAGHGDATAPAIVEQAGRLARLVENVLDLARLGAPGVRLDPAVNAAEDVIGAVVRQTRGVLDGRALRVTLPDDDDEPLAGRFDFVATLRILGNLVENALRVTPRGAEVELSAGVDGEHLALAVADRGPGIAPGDREVIFRPFHRLGERAPDGTRLGLGLAIARHLAEAQQGTLSYAARAGGGSVFTLRLPHARLTIDAEASESSEASLRG